MKVLEFLFAIINHFVRLESGRLAELKDEAFKWQNEKLEDKDSKVGQLLEKSNVWYVQIGLALASIFTIKSISDWLVNEPLAFAEEEDEMDSVYDNRTRNRKFKIGS